MLMLSRQTQWQKTKKQTKEERQAAKRAKLDPANHKSAQEVMDENARKRKRELEAEADGDDSSGIDMDIEKEKPLEGLKPSKQKKLKTEQAAAKTENDEPTIDAKATDTQSSKAKAKAEKRKQKREQKKEKQAQKQQKQANKEALQKQFSTTLEDDEASDEDDQDEGPDEHDDNDIDAFDASGLIEVPLSTATPSSANSTASTGSEVSAASSSTSIIAPTSTQDPSKKEREPKPFKYDPSKHDAFRERLNAKLEAMRAARKADGPDGRPARNRAELIEARRKKEAERRVAKKASRQLAKEDEERLKAEEQLARIRGGSGSPSLFPGRSSTPDSERNLAFGRVAWKDGQQLENNLSGFLQSGKKKGRSDPKTALEAAEKKRARINGLDEEKRKDILEKDAWLTAKKRAQGERVHDNAELLKKSLKRQQKDKAKSTAQWNERKDNVQKGKEMKQKRREANLKKRKEEKGSKGKGKKVKKPGKKVKKRPGFEGR
jgi:hypothetical protein